jgi:hypothetical protein
MTERERNLLVAPNNATRVKRQGPDEVYALVLQVGGWASAEEVKTPHIVL